MYWRTFRSARPPSVAQGFRPEALRSGRTLDRRGGSLSRSWVSPKQFLLVPSTVTPISFPPQKKPATPQALARKTSPAHSFPHLQKIFLLLLRPRSRRRRHNRRHRRRFIRRHRPRRRIHRLRFRLLRLLLFPASMISIPHILSPSKKFPAPPLYRIYLSNPTPPIQLLAVYPRAALPLQ
jgi:hypothetical protein